MNYHHQHHSHPHHQDISQPDYGTGQKKLSTYVMGVVICAVLTLIAFWVVIAMPFSRVITFSIIYAAAIIQFFIQVIYFLRLNTQTEQGQMNVMAFIFTGVILLSIVVGSLWIMWNLGYNMVH